MCTYPFTTIDDSLHLSCQGLKEFSNHSRTDNVHDAVFGINSFSESIIVDETSVKSLAPGCEMDDDIMSFGLSWWAYFLY